MEQAFRKRARAMVVASWREECTGLSSYAGVEGAKARAMNLQRHHSGAEALAGEIVKD